MPKSKRNKQVELAKTKKQGLERKKNLFSEIRSCADKYEHVFVFSVSDMRNSKMKNVRHQWKHSRFFIGKNKVMAMALGRYLEEEYLPNLHKVGQMLKGQCGLLFSNQPMDEVLSWFRSYSEGDFARSGHVATEDVILKEGPLPQFPHSLEPELRRLGLPTTLTKGIVHLVKDHEVCKVGDTLSPEAAKMLEHLGYQMAEFHITIQCVWKKDSSFLNLQAKQPDVDSQENVKKSKKKRSKSKKSFEISKNAVDASVDEDMEVVDNEDPTAKTEQETAVIEVDSSSKSRNNSILFSPIIKSSPKENIPSPLQQANGTSDDAEVNVDSKDIDQKLKKKKSMSKKSLEISEDAVNACVGDDMEVVENEDTTAKTEQETAVIEVDTSSTSRNNSILFSPILKSSPKEKIPSPLQQENSTSDDAEVNVDSKDNGQKLKSKSKKSFEISEDAVDEDIEVVENEDIEVVENEDIEVVENEDITAKTEQETAVIEANTSSESRNNSVLLSPIIRKGPNEKISSPVLQANTNSDAIADAEKNQAICAEVQASNNVELKHYSTPKQDEVKPKKIKCSLNEAKIVKKSNVVSQEKDVSNSDEDGKRVSQSRKRKVVEKKESIKQVDIANSSQESPLYRELRTRSVKVSHKKTV